MKKVDGYLSRLAQAEWPTAIVWKDANGNLNGAGPVEHFVLERQGMENVILGAVFREARAGLDALLASERSKKSGGNGHLKVNGKENEHGDVE